MSVFNTTESSFHGVTPVTSPAGISRNSFAAYYYTMEAPEAWDGTRHTTVFRARPNERWRARVLVPLERLGRALERAGWRARCCPVVDDHQGTGTSDCALGLSPC